VQESGLPLAVVGRVKTGDEMIAEALATSPHLVILETRLPKRSGLDALEELRRLQPGVLAIVVSASDRFEDAVRAVEVGVSRYLLKPLEPSRLRAVLADAVDALAP
jgi:two-component system response regulator YesN